MKSDTRLFIVHFSPLELYPPAMNAVNYFASVLAYKKIYVFTTSSAANLNYTPAGKNVRIVRLGCLKPGSTLQKRLWIYTRFNLTVLLYLFFLRPLKVLYFETISSFAPVLYKRFIRPSSRLFIHYHEYMTRIEYASGMKLIKLFHQAEKKVYPAAAWVSHTNQARMELFEKDIAPVRIVNKEIVPNYPPGAWKEQAAAAKKDNRQHAIKRLVYTGAVSLDTMYVADFAAWVISQDGQVIWDIYSLNIEPAAKDFILDLNSEYIQIKPGVYYYDLPALLSRYDAGVILYKGHILNWIYNVPNKLFEYHVCGLDVWFPKQMVTSLPFITTGTYPKIIALDFENIRSVTCHTLLDREKLSFKQVDFSYETALRSLGESLSKN
ncbi:MAG: hypothetical protein ABJB86_16695 [Bacteroidota bacterium]